MNAVVETINTAGRAFVDFALPMLIQSSLLILILLVVDAVLRLRVRAVFRYWIWLLVLVKLVLPPSLWSPVSLGTWFGATLEAPTAVLLEPEESPPALAPTTELVSTAVSILSQPHFVQPEPPVPATMETMSRTTASAEVQRQNVPEQAGLVPAETSEATAAVPSPSATLSWQGLTLLIWAAVVGALLLLLVQRAFFVRGLVAQADGAGQALLDVLRECRAGVGLRSRVSLKLSPNATSPAVCGLIRPTILVPQNLAPRLHARDLRAVLLHELAHVKRGDLWVNLVQTLLQIVYFYNPLLWLANAAMRRAREQAVDETVLVALGETAARYPETLVNVAKLAFKRRPALSLRLIGVVESKSALTARIRHILTRPIPKTAKLGLLGLLIIAGTAGVLLPMAGAAEEKASVQAVGPLDIRLVGVCPDGGDELYDADGKKLDMTIPFLGRSERPWDRDQLRRDFILEVPDLEGQLLFVSFTALCPPGTSTTLAGFPHFLDPVDGPPTVVVSEALPRTYRRTWAGLFDREVPIRKVDLTVQYFYGERGEAICTFTGPFTEGAVVQADDGRPYQLAPKSVDTASESRIGFVFATSQPFDHHVPILVYDLQGRRYLVRGGSGTSGSRGGQLTCYTEAVPWHQIAAITIGEKPHESTFRNIVVAYPKRPRRTYPADWDRMAERLGLTGLSPEELARYEFKTAPEAIAVLDVIRGSDHIQRAVQKIVLSQKPPGGVTMSNGRPVDTIVLDATAREKIRQAAMGWLKSPNIWLRAEAVKLGLTAGLREFIDPAFTLLEYRHPTVPRETRNIRGNVLTGLWRYRDSMTAADIERLKQFVRRCDDGPTWGHLFEYCFRTSRRPEVSDALWELTQDDRPWLWWPAIRALSERRDERLNASAVADESMRLRVILMAAWKQPVEEELLRKARLMLRDLFAVETVRLCPQSWDAMYRAVGNYLDRQTATAVYMDFLKAASQPQTRWRFELDYGDPSPLYDVVSNLLRDINLWHGLNTGQLGITEPGEVNESIQTARAFEQAVNEALNWYRAADSTLAGGSSVANANKNEPSANGSQGALVADPLAEDASRDSDGDGLTDFQEVHKYLTDPATADSDGDGRPDGDWDERREYAYSVRTVLRYLPPFDEDGLNDDFQDARVLNRTGEYIEVEVVHYPLATAHESISENRNWRRDYAQMTEYLAPGVTTNWDEQMQRDLLAALKADGIDVESLTDKQVVEQVSRWLMARSRSLDKVFSTFYVYCPDGRPQVYPGLEDAFKSEFERDSSNYDWTLSQHFDHELLGKGMFYNKTHGSCTSVAVYLTTALRALGIPTRMVLVTPAVDASDREQILMVKSALTHNRVRTIMLAGLSRSSRGFTNHTFNEVYVGGRWCRLDYHTLGCPIFGVHRFGLQTHVYTFNDLSDINLAATWGVRYARGERDDIFKHSNPYTAVEISERFGAHGNIANPPFSAQELSSSPLPNIFILRPLEVNVWDEFLEIVQGRTWDKTNRPHAQEYYENLFEGVWLTKPGDILVLLFSLDTPERVPQGYEDLLPRPWPEVESLLKQGQTVELSGKARNMNVILLAAPTKDELTPLVRNSKLLRAPGTSIEEQNSRPSGPVPPPSAPFASRVNENVEIELLGICDHPSEGRPWWRPDGSPMEAAPYRTTGSRLDHEEGYEDYEFALRVSSPRDTAIAWIVPGGNRGSYTGRAQGADGKPLDDIYAYTSNQNADAERANVFIGVAGGAWETCAVHRTLASEGSYTLEDNKGIAFGIAYMKGSETFVPITTNLKSEEVNRRLIAVDVDGEQHVAGGSGYGGNVLHSGTCRFDVPLNQIRELHFQRRPYTWVAYTPVSLRPGQATDVTVKLLDTDAAMAQSRRAPGQEKVCGIGPAWEALRDRVGKRYGGSIGGFSTDERRCARYFEEMLDRAGAGDTFVLMFAFDQTAAVPGQYRDLLPLPWSEIESRVGKGEQIEAQGKARDLNVVLLAAPTFEQLNTLVRQTPLLDTFRTEGSREIVLPDADFQAVMLDLATGQLVPIPEVEPEARLLEAIERMGRGDLVLDSRSLVLVRGATSEQAEDGPTELVRRVRIGRQGETFTVVTAEGGQYEITARRVDDTGCTLTYSLASIHRGLGGGAPVEPAAKLANGVTVRFMAYSQLTEAGLKWWNSRGEATTIPGVCEADVDGLGTVLAFDVHPPESEMSDVQMYRGPEKERANHIWRVPNSNIRLVALGEQRSFANVEITTRIVGPPTVELIPLTAEDRGEVVEVGKFGIDKIVDLQAIECSALLPEVAEMMGLPPGMPVDGETLWSMGMGELPVIQFTSIKSPGSYPSLVAVQDKEGLTDHLIKLTDNPRAATYTTCAWPDQLASVVVEGSPARESGVRFRNVSLTPGHATTIQVETDPQPQLIWQYSRVSLMLGALVGGLEQYRKDHGSRLPGSLAGMRGYLHDENFHWLTEHVAYIGEGGLPPQDGTRIPVAYDQTLLPQGKGTYVVYAHTDGQQVEFESPKELKELGIPPDGAYIERARPAESGFGGGALARSGERTDESTNDGEEKPFSVYGTVTDPSGRPMAGVEVTAHCGFATLMPTGQTVTDEAGRYTLRFKPGVLSREVMLQAVTVCARKSGFYEASLCRQGGLAMAGRMPSGEDQQRIARYAGVVLPNKPYELNFVMRPAARIEGELVDARGKPLPGRTLVLTGDELYPSTNALASVETDQDGAFVIESVPLESFWFEYGHRPPVRSASIPFNIPGTWPIRLKYDESAPRTPRLMIVNLRQPPPAPGPLGRHALSFDGVDDCLIVPPSPSVTVKVPLFIEVWAKPDLSTLPDSRWAPIPDEEPWPEMSLIRQGKLLPETAPAQARSSYDNTSADGLYDGWPKLRVPQAHGLNGRQSGGFMGFLLRRSGGFFAVGQDGRASQTSIFRVDPLSPDRPGWLHVYARQDYMQDQFVPSSDGPLVIGGRIVPNGLAFKGEIAEVRIWNRVLTSEEARHYGAMTLTGNEPNLVACWTFEEGNGQVVYDITGNRNHAYLGNSEDKDDADPRWIDLAAGNQERSGEALLEVSGTSDRGAGGGAPAEPGETNGSSITKTTPGGQELAGHPEAALKRLLDEAPPGSTVTIPRGRYATPVEITKPVVLRGESQEGCIIEVTADRPAVAVNTGGKGEVTVENLTMRWQLATSGRVEQPFALAVKDTNAVIRNCCFVPLGDYRRSPVAVRIDGFSKATVDNCRFNGFEYVICYGEGTEGTVQDCVITDCGHQGVINYSGATLTVQRCLITGSKFHAVRCTGGTLHVEDNLLIENANRGIYLGNKSGRGTITNNVILGNGTGISGFARAEYTIANNVIVDHSYAGIDMRDSCRLDIHNNVLAKNRRGLGLFKEGTENSNVVGKNTYWANGTDVENMDKPEESLMADPLFADPNHGDFSVRGPAQEARHGLTNPQIIRELWKKYEQLQRERPAEPATRADSVPSPAQAQVSTPAPSRTQSPAVLAWQRTDLYVPPDPDGFFPDDLEGGRKLDALFQAVDKDKRSDEEILSTVRQGLRRTTQHRTLVLAWIGNRYIWGKEPQNPQAIEIMYHAVPLERHYAIYFGLSVVKNKSPNLLRTLADICMQGEEVGRITWGIGPQRDEILSYLTPYLQDRDAGKREIAGLLVKHFRGELDFEKWQRERRLEQIKVEFQDQLPQLRETLLTGDSQARREALGTIQRNGLGSILDDSFLAALAAAATDRDSEVRNDVARLAGGRWVWNAPAQEPNAIDLMLQLSRDGNREVYYNAVYFGLSTVRDKGEPVVRRLVEMALAEHENNLYGRIVWGLKGPMKVAPEPFVKTLAQHLDRAKSDVHYAASVYLLYRDVLEQEPPGEWGLAHIKERYPEDLFAVPFSAREPFVPKDTDALWTAFIEKLPEGIAARRLPEWIGRGSVVCSAGVRGREQTDTVIESIESNPRLRLGESYPLPLSVQLFLEEKYGPAGSGPVGGLPESQPQAKEPAPAEGVAAAAAAPGAIQQRIDAAAPGATIRLEPGVYKERLVINKPLTLEGAGWDKTVVMTEKESFGSLEEMQRIVMQRVAQARSDAEREQIAAQVKKEFVEKMSPLMLSVENAQGVVVQGIKFSSPGGRVKGASVSLPIVKFDHSRARMADCAVLAGPGNGIHIQDGSDVEIDRTLVAAVWGTGLGVTSGAEPSRAHVHDSDIRNCHYAGIRIVGRSAEAVIERCRISGAAWHGVRYDNVAPILRNNLIFGNARCGIYASGQTAATVKDNLLYDNEMTGMSCWFQARDLVEGNTFVSNKEANLALAGAAKPDIRRNVFYGSPVGVSLGNINEDSPFAKSEGTVALQDNLFWLNDQEMQLRRDAHTTEILAVGEDTGTVRLDPVFTAPAARDFSLRADSPARLKGLGAADLLPFDSPWPLQPEELAIIPKGDTRDSRQWREPS